MSELPPKTPRKVTLEDLLRLKRLERPGPEYWLRFDRELNERVWQALAKPVESRWNLATLFVMRNLRWLGAGAVSAVVLGLAWQSQTLAPLQQLATISPVKIASNFVSSPAVVAFITPGPASVVPPPPTPENSTVSNAAQPTFAVATMTSQANSHKVPAIVAFAAARADGVRYATDTLNNAVDAARLSGSAY